MLSSLIKKLPIDPISAQTPDTPHSIELFAGAGGLSLGAELAGFNRALACEQNPTFAYTFHTNLCERHSTILQREAAHPLPNRYTLPSEIALISGGPPCQPFSTAQGNSSGDDNRADALFYPIRWAEEYRPHTILIENVPNLKHKHEDTLAEFRGELERLGYETKTTIINTADYLVPQTRNRLFILGVHNSVPTPAKWFPQPLASDQGAQTTLHGKQTMEWQTCQDALEDLPEPLPSQPPSEDPLHETIADTPVSVESDGTHKVDPHAQTQKLHRDDWRIDVVPPNHIQQDHRDSSREKYSNYRLGYMNDSGDGGTTERRLDPSKPAPTMTGSNGTPPIHYQGKSPETPSKPVDDIRRLTPREVGRIQTFPDNFAVAGDRKEQYLQFANAVPPLLGFVLTHHIHSHILNGNPPASEHHQQKAPVLSK